MRRIKYIVVHCTAGSQRNKAADVVAYHCRTLGWSRPGYHYIVEADGTVVNTLDEAQTSNGVKSSVTDADGERVNALAINICWIGGVDTSKPGLPAIDNRTAAQRASLELLLRQLRRKYPEAMIRGHRDFQRKACPSFDATKEYKDI